MPNLVMDFLEKALPTAGSVVGGIAGEIVDPLGGEIVGAGLGGALGRFAENEATHQGAGSGVLQSAIGGAVGQGVGEGVGSLLGDTGSGLVQAAIKGGAVGGTASAGSALATGERNPKNLAMDFLQGAGVGAVTGGVAEGIKNGPALNQVGTLMPGKASDIISPEDLETISKTENEKTVASILEPYVGKKVAQDVAPAIAGQKDPEIIKNMIDQDVNEKLAPALSSPTGLETSGPTTNINTPAQVAAEETAPLPPTTPESNVNTPEQVSGEEQSLFNTAPRNNELESLEQKAPSPFELEEQKNAIGPNSEATPSKPFMNPPGEEAPKTHVGSLADHEYMKYQLENGATPANAVANFVEHGKGTSEDGQAIIDNLMKGDSGLSFNKGLVGAEANPEFERASKLLPEANSKDQAMINPKVVHNELTRLANRAMDDGNNLSEEDQALMDTAHGKTLRQLLPQAQDKEAFRTAFQSLKKYDDTKQGIESGALQGRVPYKQNHLLQTRYANSEDQIRNALRTANLNKRPGFTRSIDNYQDAMDMGLTPKNAMFDEGGNPTPGMVYRDLADDLKQSRSMLGQQALKQGLEKAYGAENVKVGDIGVNEQGLWKQLQVPYGGKISMPAHIADEINARAPAPETTGAWKGYDTLNGNWKNLELGGGAFHGVNTFGNWIGQQISSGRIFTHPQDTINVIRSIFDKDFVANTTKEWDDEGSTLLEDRAGLQANMQHAQGDIKLGGRMQNIPGLKQMHEAIFARQIPFMMKLEFHQDIEGLDPSNPDDQAEMVKIAKSINQRYGAFNRDIQGVTPRTAKLAGRGVLAWDWNEGQVRTLIDAMSKGGIEGKLARQTVFGKALIFGGLATAGAAAGGEFKNQSPKDVAMDILSKTINPSFQIGGYKVGLPTTQLSLAGKPIQETIENAINGSSLTNPTKDLLSARLAAVPSAIEQWSENRNFSGQPLRGTDYYGRPIGAGREVANLASLTSPIPVTQGLEAGTGEENLAAAAGNIAGLRVSSDQSLSYAPVAAQTYIQQLAMTTNVPPEELSADTQFVQALGNVGVSRTKTVAKAETAYINKDMSKAQDIMQTYNTKLLSALKPWESSNGPQFLNAQLLGFLRQQMITDKDIGRNAQYDVETNPLAYGQSLTPLRSAPQSSVANSQQLISSTLLKQGGL